MLIAISLNTNFQTKSSKIVSYLPKEGLLQFCPKTKYKNVNLQSDLSSHDSEYLIIFDIAINQGEYMYIICSRIR